MVKTLEDRLKRLAKRSWNSILGRKKNIQKELDRMFFFKKRQDLIIRTKFNNPQKNSEIADCLSNDIGAKEYFVFQNIPFIAVSCSRKDIDSVCAALNNRQSGYLKNSSIYLSHLKKAARSVGFYTPEMYLKMAEDMGLPAFEIPPTTMAQGWNLFNIKATHAWRTTTGTGATTLVIDTGIDYNHPELAGRFEGRKGYDFVHNDDNPKDDNGHGTHVAGIVAGHSTGVAPTSTLLAAKVLDKNGSGSNTDVIRAIDYAISDKGIDIINMSLGSSGYSYALDRVCKKAYQSGLIVCAAAGNEGYGADYPAACSGVISVAAVDSANKHANFSNIHGSVDISCPGVSIHSTYPGRGYKILSGTSMASPHCAGVAALATSMKGNLGSKEFESTMYKSALELGKGESYQKEKYGAGLPQSDKIVSSFKDNSVLRRLKLW